MGLSYRELLDEWDELAAHLSDKDRARERSFEKPTDFNSDTGSEQDYGDKDVESWYPHEMIDNAQQLSEDGPVDNILVGCTLPMDVLFGNSRLLMRKVGGQQLEALGEIMGSQSGLYNHRDPETDQQVIIREETVPSDNLRPLTQQEVTCYMPEQYLEKLDDIAESANEYISNQASILQDYLEEKTSKKEFEAGNPLEMAESLDGTTAALVAAKKYQQQWNRNRYESVIPLTPLMTYRHIDHVHDIGTQEKKDKLITQREKAPMNGGYSPDFLKE